MTVTLKPIDQQVMVITGASSGIGLVTARMAAARGAKVMMVARDGDAMAEAAAAMRAAGGDADHHVADVGEMAQVEAAAAATVARFGRIDTWVNNAGVSIYAKLMETPLDEHERMFRTNYFGAVHGATAAVPRLAQQGGALITVASIAADMATPVMGAYAATKHAVKAYIGALRMELRAAGTPVSITLVKPSGIDTPVAQHASNKEGGEAQIPPPVYDPTLVAEAILNAAVRPRREITIGGAGRAQVLFAEHFPVAYEWLAPKIARVFVDRDKVQPRPDILFATARAGHERSGEHDARKTSSYTAAMLHPAATAMVAGGVALGLLALWTRRRIAV